MSRDDKTQPELVANIQDQESLRQKLSYERDKIREKLKEFKYVSPLTLNPAKKGGGGLPELWEKE